MRQRIPTIMYHSIGVLDKKWQWNHLTCPYDIFENQLKWLKSTGYETLNFQEVYDFILNGETIPKKSVFLTFDDGYLDNYIFAYPILKKYGMKGTIFVNPDFVDKSQKCRKTLDEFNKNMDFEKSDFSGFCNWKELIKMDSEGILEVQSHAKTHTWYPISNKIIDFRHPEDDYVWMDWNDNPEQKPFLQFTNWDEFKYGQAVFEHEKALSSKRVFVNMNFQEDLHLYVRNNGKLAFFDKQGWRDELLNYAKKIETKYNIIDKVESHKEYMDRLKYELEFTKNELEFKLNKKINFLCWPGGSGTKEGVEIAEELGYLMTTAAQDLPGDVREKIKNSQEWRINRLSRFTPVMVHNKEKGIIKYSPGWFFILQLLKFQNKLFAGYWVKVLHYFIIKINK